MKQVRYLIIGAGPCGLGAGFRLKELGCEDFLIVERESEAGGLARSFVDQAGFTWDIGGHVQFSHYEDFDRLTELVLPNQWLTHQRESWIWMLDRFIPYPFQNNLWRLPENLQKECLEGLAKPRSSSDEKPKNFKEWMHKNFGAGLCRLFMEPYNFKVWAYPPEQMNAEWVGERVATVDLEKLKKNIALQKDEPSWGPNAVFRFPAQGGTGALWKGLGERLGEKFFSLGRSLESIDLKNRRARLNGGEEIRYESLLSTLPMNRLLDLCGLNAPREFLSSNSHIVGIGLEGKTPEVLRTKCWMYFPEENCPFYRVTVFSNYSPNNVPDASRHWSLMAEVSESPHRKLNSETIIEDVIAGMKSTKLISSADKIISRWHYAARPGYPTPFLHRNALLDKNNLELEAHGVFSRGRFGFWKYEVSNQDHSFMQGFEWAERILKQIKETTAFQPELVNSGPKIHLKI